MKYLKDKFFFKRHLWSNSENHELALTNKFVAFRNMAMFDLADALIFLEDAVSR